jgi:hypothetical protein
MPFTWFILIFWFAKFNCMVCWIILHGLLNYNCMVYSILIAWILAFKLHPLLNFRASSKKLPKSIQMRNTSCVRHLNKGKVLKNNFFGHWSTCVPKWQYNMGKMKVASQHATRLKYWFLTLGQKLSSVIFMNVIHFWTIILIFLTCLNIFIHF